MLIADVHHNFLLSHNAQAQQLFGDELVLFPENYLLDWRVPLYSGCGDVRHHGNRLWFGGLRTTWTGPAPYRCVVWNRSQLWLTWFLIYKKKQIVDKIYIVQRTHEHATCSSFDSKMSRSVECDTWKSVTSGQYSKSVTTGQMDRQTDNGHSDHYMLQHKMTDAPITVSVHPWIPTNYNNIYCNSTLPLNHFAEMSSSNEVRGWLGSLLTNKDGALLEWRYSAPYMANKTYH